MIKVLSTKILSEKQRRLFPEDRFMVSEYNAILTEECPFEIPEGYSQLILTSQNAVRAFFNRAGSKKQYSCYCVGEKTRALLEEFGQKVLKTAQNAAELGHFIAKNYENEQFLYACGNLSRPELPELLKAKNIPFRSIIVYKTRLNEQKLNKKTDAILFFSPSGVKSYIAGNAIDNTTVFCIGNTTAEEAKKHIRNIIISENPTTEDLIRSVVSYYQTIVK